MSEKRYDVNSRPKTVNDSFMDVEVTGLWPNGDRASTVVRLVPDRARFYLANGAVIDGHTGNPVPPLDLIEFANRGAQSINSPQGTE